jgi:hypothetical protein
MIDPSQKTGTNWTYVFLASLLFIALLISEKSSYSRYFGSLDPVILFFLTSLLGYLLIPVIKQEHSRAVGSVTALETGFPFIAASVFFLSAVLLDVYGRFPPSLNISFPQSILFYPVIGFVVEIGFHVIPLALLVWVGNCLKSNKIVRNSWFLIIVVASVEPLYQIILGSAERSVGFSVMVGIHVLAINIVAVYLFMKYSFFSMYSLRLIYYMYWHILWGEVRLRILF